MIHLNAGEQRLYWELIDVLRAQRSLPEVLAEAYRPLRRLIAVDHGAACVSRAGGPEEYDWFGSDLPEALFAGYRDMAAYDFVRKAAVARPGVALRDEEMLPRREIERNMLYQACRERGLLLEQVMTVLLPIERAAHGGLTLYRSRRRPFSARERGILQLLAPTLELALRSHYLLGEAASRAAALDALLGRGRGAAVLILPPATVLWRTGAVEPLLARWFAPVERARGGLPEPLRERLRTLAAARPGAAPSSPWVRRGDGADLRVSLLQVPQGHRPMWLLVLEEVLQAGSIPPGWAERLTPGEVKVVERVLRGWDNALIAADLGCTVATVKKHLQRVFDKLGVPSRAALLHEAQNRPRPT